MAGYVFHELRNDTNATVGVLECTIKAVENSSATLPPELISMVYETRVHARHATQVIMNILDYSKVRRRCPTATAAPRVALLIDGLGGAFACGAAARGPLGAAH